MMLFETVCRGNHKNAWGVFALFSGIAVLAFLAMNFEIGKPIIAQVVLMVSLIVAAYVQIRFISTAFLYQVFREADGDYLLVSRKQGRRAACAAKLPLAHLKWIERVDTRKAAPPVVEGTVAANYSAYIFSDVYELVFFDDGGERVLLRLNADEAFLSALSSYVQAPENGANAEESQDEENAEE